MDPVVVAEPESAPFTLRTAWFLVGVALVVVLGLHLVPGLLAGLLVYSLLHRLDGRLRRRGWANRRNARLLALGLLGVVGLGLAVGLGALILAAWKTRTSAIPELLARMAAVLESTRARLGNNWIPPEMADAEGLRQAASHALHAHAAWLRSAGGDIGRMAAHVLAGLAIGVLAAFHHPDPEGPRPLAEALGGRLQRFLKAFEAVVFAQIRISALNTVFTALYLYAVLPLFGVHLPLRLTLVAVTFMAGLLPVIGNLMSNTAIVLLSLGAGPGVALGSLLFLVGIHKLEYFFNARIVGSRIHAQAWEVLLAMVIMEVAFGTPGLVLAPILYAYLKGELKERGWV